MRLLIATGLYPPEIGGPATYTKLFEERLPKEGIEVTVLPFSTVRYLPPVIRHAAYTWKLIRIARSADCILVQDTVSTGVPAALAAKITGKKLVVRVPGDYAWEQGTQRFGVQDSLDEFQSKTYSFRVDLLRKLQAFTVRSATRIIAPSHYLARIISGWLPATRDIEVIYNGVALGTESRQRDFNLIVTSGRLVPWKGFGALIDIVAKSSWELAILGDGPGRLELALRIKKAKAEERIKLYGNVSREEMQKWLARATVFALNTRYEGLSHTLIEAMGTGASVITTNVGGNPEIIEDGTSGLLYNAGNNAALERSLALLMQDVALRERLGKAAYVRAKDFYIDTCVSTTAELLKSL